jgi:hypothetical protein
MSDVDPTESNPANPAHNNGSKPKSQARHSPMRNWARSLFYDLAEALVAWDDRAANFEPPAFRKRAPKSATSSSSRSAPLAKKSAATACGSRVSLEPSSR